MKFKAITINLMVADVQASVDFYSGHFEFDVLATVPNDAGLVFAMIKRDEVTIMLQTLSSFAEENPKYQKSVPGGTVLLYIDVSDVIGLYEKLQSKQIPIVKDLHDTFYGTKEFSINDCDGYLISFAQDMNQ
jgi:uncharacterized glyoxalase superfamily protein PhnB